MSLTATELSPAADCQGSVFSYVSPTRLNLWIRCPLAFWLRYIDGIKTPTTPGLFIGTAVHRGLEVFYRHRQLGILLEPAEVTRRMLECWAPLVDEEDMRFESTADEQAAQHQATGLVTAYIRQLPADEPRPLAVEAAVEAPLIVPATGEDLGIPLVGIMDLVLGGSNGPTVVDFKTSARSSEPLEIIHEVQLSSYAYLFRRAWPQSESGLEIRSLIKTKVPKIEVHRHPPRTEAHFRRLFAVIREYLDALDRNRFSYRPGFGCAMCDYREQCSRWAG